MENSYEYLPPGFIFEPTNTELLTGYLLNKNRGLPLPCDYIIIDCDLYDEKGSWKEIFDGSPAGTNNLYFFTKQKKATGKGLRIKRQTGGGTWKETQKCGTIHHSRTNQPIGTKKSFKFVPNKDTAGNFAGRWLMDEYSLDSRLLHQDMDEYVVCHIKHERDLKSKALLQTNEEQHVHNNPMPIAMSEEHCRNSSNYAATTSNSFDSSAQAIATDADNSETLIIDSNPCTNMDWVFDSLDGPDQTTTSTLADWDILFDVDELLSPLDGDRHGTTTTTIGYEADFTASEQ